jgi:hypothetical protein
VSSSGIILVVRTPGGVSAAQAFIIASVASECLAFVVIPKFRMSDPGSKVHWMLTSRTNWMIINAKMKAARLVLK